MFLGIDISRAFIPRDPEAGYEAEIDWGAATAILAGEEVRLKFFCMRSKYSGKHFVRFFFCDGSSHFLMRTSSVFFFWRNFSDSDLR